MKFETLSNIISNLWYEDDIDEIRVQLRINKFQFRHDVMTYKVVLVCRDLAISNENELRYVINDVLLTGVTRLIKAKYDPSINNPKIIDVSISPSHIDKYVTDVVVTLGILGGIIK